MENTKIFRQEICNVDYKQVVYLKEYIIYEQLESQDKYAIFKFYNNYVEKINAIEFIIKQYDENNQVIAENVFKYSNFVGDKQAFFSPYTKLMVEDECVRLEAILVKADFENHHYEDCKLISQRDLVNMERGLKPSRKERNKVRTRKLKNKNKIRYFLLAPFLLSIFVLATIYFYNSVVNYANNIKEFSDNNFHYIVDGNNAIVDKYLGDKSDIEIISEIDLGTRKLTVSKIAQKTFNSSQIETVNITAPNIEIEEYAFANCINLKTFKANNISTVGKYSFSGCSVLEEFEATSIKIIGEGAFSGCAGLKEFAFNKTEEIKSQAFSNCIGLTSVWGEDINLIGDNAFSGCEAITTISVPKAKIELNAFPSNLAITEINFGTVDYRFGGIFGLENDKLPESLTKIICNAELVHRKMFDGIGSNIELSFRNEKVVFEFLALSSYYKSLYGDSYFYNNLFEILDGEIIGINGNKEVIINKDTLVDYPKEVTSISPDAFASLDNMNVLTIDIDGIHLTNDSLAKAKSLHRLNLGSGVTFEQDALSKCKSINELIINEFNDSPYQALVANSSITYIVVRSESIPNYAFLGMDKVKSISLPNAISLGEGVFKDCSSLMSVTMPNVNLTEIPNETFSGCESLESFDLYNVTKIGNNAFMDCSKIYIDLNNSSLIEIGNNAFYNCDNLYNIYFGYNVKSIGDYAFSECDNINSINFSSYDKLEILGNNAFTNCKNLSIVGVMPYTIKSLGYAFGGENKISYLEMYNYSLPLSNLGEFTKLQELRVHQNPLGNGTLVTNFVNNLPELKILYLPCEMNVGGNVVDNCPKLTFVDLYVSDGDILLIGSGCPNLKYVTVYNNNIDFNYHKINASAPSTVSLYIKGRITNQTSISGIENLQTLSVDYIDATHFGQIFGSNDFVYQGEYIPSTLKNVEISNTDIPSYFFYNCSNIENLALLEATNIGFDAITGLSNLKNIYFGRGVNNVDFINGFNDTSYNRIKPNVIYECYESNNYLFDLSVNLYKENYGSRSYDIFDKEGSYLGVYDHIFVYSVEEIMDRYNLSSSLSFSRVSNTPAILEVFSTDRKLYSFEPKPFDFKAYEQLPIKITYVLEDNISYYDLFTADSTFELPTPVSIYGKTFMGWFTDPMCTSKFEVKDDTSITSDITLYAKFEDLSQYNVVNYNSIHKIDLTKEHLIMSGVNSSVDVFAYSNSSFEVMITDENGNIVNYLNNDSNNIVLDLSLYSGYFISLKFNNEEVYISYKFDGNMLTYKSVNIDVDNNKYHDFKFEDGKLNGLVIPNYTNYKFLGWYDQNNNLIIDTFGNLYSYNGGNLYAKWEVYE